VDYRLLWTIAYLETRFDPSLASRKGARGLMQFMPDTARRYGLASPHDPASAIEAAAKYVKTLSSRFGNRPDLVLAAYNAGEVAVEAYLKGRSITVGKRLINPRGIATDGVPPFRETREYVENGMKILANFPADVALRPRNQTSNTTASMIRDEPRNSAGISIRPSLNLMSEQPAKGLSRRSIYFVKVGEDE
jgi:hypothetical protein